MSVIKCVPYSTIMHLINVFSNLRKRLSRFFIIILQSVCQISDRNHDSEKQTMEMEDYTQQVRVLTLNNGEHLDGILYRLKKEWTVQFKLGPTLLGKELSMYINHPVSPENQFKRNTYYKLEWANEVDGIAKIKLTVAGSFHYYVAPINGKPFASGYLLVDPVLKIGEEEELPLDCIQIQTVLAKCLGPFFTWEEKLLVARNSGYNAIHFTPIQELGESKSSYSLKNQLSLNPNFNNSNREITYNDLKYFVNKMRTEWKMLSICDIVLNHTANETPFLTSHPECTYNCKNCLYLRPAYILDALLFELTVQVAAGEWEFKGIPTVIETEDHLNSIRHALHTHFVPFAKIHEMYIVDVNEIVAQFLDLARNRIPNDKEHEEHIDDISIIQDPKFRRLKSTIDMQCALRKYNTYRNDCFDEETRLKRCAEDLKNKLQQLNEVIINSLQSHLNAAIENAIANIKYFRVNADGPRIKEISEKSPLVPRYFTDYGTPKSLLERENIMYSDDGCYLMAHNGWVMNGDPLKNFAEEDSHTYLRRELIAWGDSVKLRYGTKPQDCPFLWLHMRVYIEEMAAIFDGIRLDNCHSTPIPVAEYMLDAARLIRPDLYVIAELFTNSDQKDNIFVNRLGITSLIREAMSAGDSHELGRLVYRYGGEPVGAFLQPSERPLVPSIAHALFMDVTHDNPSPVEKRSVFDLLPSAALVSMACCASGSNRGYDELVPHYIHVVDEQRQYTSWTNDDFTQTVKYVHAKSGIIAAKKALNDLHYMLGRQHFSQVFVDQIDSDIVTVTRHSPITHESVVLVAFTAFKHPGNSSDLRRYIKPLRIEGVVEEIILESWISHVGVSDGKSRFSLCEKYTMDIDYINGLSEYALELRQHIQCCDSKIIKKVDSGNSLITQLDFVNLQPGSVIAIRVALHSNIKYAVVKLQDTIRRITSKKDVELQKIISLMDFSNLNVVLYRCDQEEREETSNKFGVYNVPGYGPLVYAGLQGVISLLADIRSRNDLGHPLCANLREGNWMIDYVWQRLKENEDTKSLATWFEEVMKPFKIIPRYLVPSFFDAIIVNVYMDLLDHCFSLMSSFVKNGNTFVKLLSLVSVQVGGVIRSSQLPDLSPNLKPPKPKIKKLSNGTTEQLCLTLSAGLPHFATGYMRNWGRDTFIALRGLLLLTGRHEEARFIILGFAGTLRHGLIPNLLDKGYNSRYNCRDAVWWWLYTIKCYVEDVPNGIYILSDTVTRLFPTDDSTALAAGDREQPLYDVMQEALTVHFRGLCFRERFAGRQIDEHMTERGFNNQIGVNPDTGFVFGGNDSNCGTWMDKMGSSEKAGNKGRPATSRDGSAIEIIGLSKCVLTFLAELHDTNQFPYGIVERICNGKTVIWSYKQWADKIQANFEKYFYVNELPSEDEKESKLIHRRGIYKDTYGAKLEWADYQFRPNFLIAMVVAPELFDGMHARTALKNAEKILLGPLGMKTLDPADWAYNGYYDNSNDSEDIKLAHGWNYHQGPEWIWPIGYFLRAYFHFESFGTIDDLKRVVEWIETEITSQHFIEISNSHWRGLPELTNENGSYCKDSCRTQAWSASTILELLYDLQNVKQKLQHFQY